MASYEEDLGNKNKRGVNIVYNSNSREYRMNLFEVYNKGKSKSAVSYTISQDVFESILDKLGFRKSQVKSRRKPTKNSSKT